MKWLLTLFPVAASLLFGCTNPADSNNTTRTSTIPTDTTQSDTINYALNEDSVKMAINDPKPPEGFYQVTLPCTNCKGIEHTILFNPDLSFQLEENVLGPGSVTRTAGTWKPVHEAVWLYKDSSVVAHYAWQGDTLNYIDPKSGVRIPLRPLPAARNVPAWQAKKATGVVFFGVGNEPFWNLTINGQKNIVFNRADAPAPVSFKVVKPLITADSTVYQTKNDSAMLRVVIYNRFCSDGMSDNMYNNKVMVRYNDTTYSGCGIMYR